MADEAKLKTNALPLLDWRRRVASLYAEVRATLEPRVAHQIWLDGRNWLLRSHPESPIPADCRAGFTGVPVASYDPSLRFIANVDTDVAPARLEMKTGTDGIVVFERAGVVRLADVGELDVWWLFGYGGGLFLPIKDTRTDGATYGGGRYVLDTVKGADLGGSDGHLVVDLNFAYNPSCAYDPAWACPLAQAGNTVPVPVNAGELLPGHGALPCYRAVNPPGPGNSPPRVRQASAIIATTPIGKPRVRASRAVRTGWVRKSRRD